MYTLENLMELAKSANGRAKKRTIGKGEAAEMLGLLEKYQNDENVEVIRVYSQQGFVPNSYKFRCDIRYFEAKKVDGIFKVLASFSSAQRSRGHGALVTVNGRASTVK